MKSYLKSPKSKDLARKPHGFLVTWGVPIGFFFMANLPVFYGTPAVILIIAGFSWMGTGCLINAKRCRRRHCFFTGPLFLLAALLSAFMGFGWVDFGPNGLMYVVWGTFLLAGLGFAPELIWGKYLKQKN